MRKKTPEPKQNQNQQQQPYQSERLQLKRKESSSTLSSVAQACESTGRRSSSRRRNRSPSCSAQKSEEALAASEEAALASERRPAPRHRKPTAQHSKRRVVINALDNDASSTATSATEAPRAAEHDEYEDNDQSRRGGRSRSISQRKGQDKPPPLPSAKSALSDNDLLTSDDSFNDAADNDDRGTADLSSFAPHASLITHNASHRNDDNNNKSGSESGEDRHIDVDALSDDGQIAQHSSHNNSVIGAAKNNGDDDDDDDDHNNNSEDDEDDEIRRPLPGARRHRAAATLTTSTGAGRKSVGRPHRKSSTRLTRVAATSRSSRRSNNSSRLRIDDEDESDRNHIDDEDDEEEEEEEEDEVDDDSVAASDSMLSAASSSHSSNALRRRRSGASQRQKQQQQKQKQQQQQQIHQRPRRQNSSRVERTPRSSQRRRSRSRDNSRASSRTSSASSSHSGGSWSSGRSGGQTWPCRATESQTNAVGQQLAASTRLLEITHLNKPYKLNTFEPLDCLMRVAATCSSGDNSAAAAAAAANAAHQFHSAAGVLFGTVNVFVGGSQKPITLRCLQEAPDNLRAPPHHQLELPAVNVTTMHDYPHCDVNFSLPSNYIKFIEKTSEELDDEVEYDMDEEDNVWLKLVNEQRMSALGDLDSALITQEQFELLMDRLEKECYFQAATSTASSSNSTNSTTSAAAAASAATGVDDAAAGSASALSIAGASASGVIGSSSVQNASFLSKSNNDSTNEDALCCICLDGECLNSNAILFCDMCNLAVHQECYGVPYIPEGQWLCRRCLQSPSLPVACMLCPNRHGAFKQTDRGQWAHVVCAIWIPEVHFANTVFLEPIIGTENIDRARWKLMCYICRKRNVGACIQCDRQNCYTAFHVTCAQQAGLYMNIREELIDAEPLPTPASVRRKKSVKNNKNGASSGGGGGGAGNSRMSKQRQQQQQQQQLHNASFSSASEVKKCAFCDIHTPLDVLSPRTRKSISSRVGSGGGGSSAFSTTGMTAAEMLSAECEEALKRAQKMRMKRARKILAERRNAPPQICLPTIPPERIQEIAAKVDVAERDAFFAKLLNYWLLKRYSRNGVPLLRRLQHVDIKKTSAPPPPAAPLPLPQPPPPSSAQLPASETEPSLSIKQCCDEAHAAVAAPQLGDPVASAAPGAVSAVAMSHSSSCSLVSEASRAQHALERDKLIEQLAYWKKMRQDLERARLLMELVRKRERLKRDMIKLDELAAQYELNPLNGVFLQRLLDLLVALDKQRVFCAPVSAEDVPDYYTTIREPMCFERMQQKLNELAYQRLDQFEHDLHLIISNCLTYNKKTSFYYKTALKMRDQCAPLLKQSKRLYERLGLGALAGEASVANEVTAASVAMLHEALRTLTGAGGSKASRAGSGSTSSLAGSGSATGVCTANNSRMASDCEDIDDHNETRDTVTSGGGGKETSVILEATPTTAAAATMSSRASAPRTSTARAKKSTRQPSTAAAAAAGGVGKETAEPTRQQPSRDKRTSLSTAAGPGVS